MSHFGQWTVVRYLRMLSNSIAGAVLVAAYLLVLMLQLNPALPLASSRLGPLALTIVLLYGVHANHLFLCPGRASGHWRRPR